jgi:hypothetical protein
LLKESFEKGKFKPSENKYDKIYDFCAVEGEVHWRLMKSDEFKCENLDQQIIGVTYGENELPYDGYEKDIELQGYKVSNNKSKINVVEDENNEEEDDEEPDYNNFGDMFAETPRTDVKANSKKKNEQNNQAKVPSYIKPNDLIVTEIGNTGHIILETETIRNQKEKELKDKEEQELLQKELLKKQKEEEEERERLRLELIKQEEERQQKEKEEQELLQKELLKKQKEEEEERERLKLELIKQEEEREQIRLELIRKQKEKEQKDKEEQEQLLKLELISKQKEEEERLRLELIKQEQEKQHKDNEEKERKKAQEREDIERNEQERIRNEIINRRKEQEMRENQYISNSYTIAENTLKCDDNSDLEFNQLPNKGYNDFSETFTSVTQIRNEDSGMINYLTNSGSGIKTSDIKLILDNDYEIIQQNQQKAQRQMQDSINNRLLVENNQRYEIQNKAKEFLLNFER